MSIKSSYFDFLLHGVSFASNAYCYQEDKKPWQFDESRLNQIRAVWSKNFWVSAGLSLSITFGGIFCSSLIGSPNLTTLGFIFCIILSVGVIIRLCQACQQSMLSDQRSCDLSKRLENLEQSLHRTGQLIG